MSKKLSKKERENVVTKGYLFDLMEKQEFLIFKYFKSKGFVTKKELNLDDYITKEYYYDSVEEIVERRLKKLKSQHRSDIEILMEHHLHQLQTLFEGLDNRYVLRKEWKPSGFGRK
jgi:hypothetical protein